MGNGTRNGWQQRWSDAAGLEGRQDVAERGGELADGNIARREGGPGVGIEGSQHGSIAGSRPIFPPGRDDFGRWADLAAGGLDPTHMPAIESGVSVVADGMAPPSDLLRLGGNGVNPLCAAWAFINLLACLVDGVADTSASGTLFADHFD